MVIRVGDRALLNRVDEPLKGTISFDGKQVGRNERPLEQVPVECDAAAGRLDEAVIETRRLEGAYLIIIGRLGTAEPSRLNRS